MDNAKIGNKNDNKKCSWWKERTTMERYLILICLSFLVALISFIAVLIIYRNLYTLSMRNICTSPACKREAGRILKGMDESINPCEDFYNFACGSYRKYERISDGEVSTIMDTLEYILLYSKDVLEEADESFEPEFIKKVKTFYHSCINRLTDTSEIIKELLNKSNIRIWPFPVYNNTTIEELLTLEEILSITMTFNKDGGNPLFSLMKHGEIFLLRNGRSFVDETIFLNMTSEEYLKKKEKYTRLFIWTQFQAMEPSYIIEDEVYDVVNFQTSLANITSVEREEDETNVTISNLKKVCPEIKWELLLKHIYEKHGHSDEAGNLGEKTITVKCKECIRDICQLIKKWDQGTIYNFLGWNFLAQALLHLDISFYKRFCEIDPSYRFRIKHFSINWKHCINAVRESESYHPGLDYLLIERMQPDSYIKEVEEYLKDIKAAMDRMFVKQDWLDDHTKKIARNRLSNIYALIGFSNESRDIDLLKKHFINITVSENFIENFLQERNIMFSADFFNDIFTLQTNIKIAQPMYFGASGHEDGIVIPLGIMVPPIFVPGVPKYLNYGSIGFLVAHELSHSFDSEGRGLFEDHNKITKVNKTLQIFKMKQECYINQYSALPLDDSGSVMVDGEDTIMDNIADNSGIIQAFSAYIDYLKKNGEEKKLPALSYTNRQIFFIKYAQLWCEIVESPAKRYKYDGHSPGKYRAQETLKNFPSFSQEFHCPLGSHMNPSKKCRLWG